MQPGTMQPGYGPAPKTLGNPSAPTTTNPKPTGF